MQDDSDVRSRPGPLSGWRAIAEYLGRNQSTVKRWASDGGLPVHRPQGSAARKGVPVYAFPDELDTWLRGHRLNRLPRPSESETAETSPAQIPTDSEPAPDHIPPADLPDPPMVARAGWSRRTLMAGGLGLSALLAAGLGLWGKRAGQTPAASVSGDARSLYNRGLFYLNLRTREGLSRAIALFQDVLALEPDFNDARAGLAQAYNLSAQYLVLPPEEAYPAALRTARELLAAAPEHPGGLAALAFASFYWLRDFSGAYELFERAIARDPDNADVHHWYALAIMHDRKFDVAIREVEEAHRLSPTSPGILANKALILHHAGQHADALAILEPLATTQPGLLSPVSYLATIYLDIGRDADFIAAYRQAADLVEDRARQEIADAASRGLAGNGRTAMLDSMLAVQTRLFDEGRERAFKVAITAAYLRQVERTLDYLELAIRRHEPDILGARLELPVDLLTGSQRYVDLVRQIGFSIE